VEERVDVARHRAAPVERKPAERALGAAHDVLEKYAHQKSVTAPNAIATLAAKRPLRGAGPAPTPIATMDSPSAMMMKSA
jgi:hypothetical protein